VKLSEFDINKKGKIVALLENPAYSKLVEFGIFPGVSFYILNKAAFNGPIFIKIGANRIALRTEEAQAIEVEE